MAQGPAERGQPAGAGGAVCLQFHESPLGQFRCGFAPGVGYGDAFGYRHDPVVR